MRRLTILLVLVLGAALLWAGKKKKKGPDDLALDDQVIQSLPEPPTAVATDTAHLQFRAVPLTAKGLLTQQLRDGVRTLLKTGPLVHVRAFVAGTGDLRRVKEVVAEECVARKLPLPAVTTVQVGALPLEGAQVQLLGIIRGKAGENVNGLLWLPATQPAALQQQLAGLTPLQTVCYTGSLEHKDGIPGDAVLMQTRRLPTDTPALCEAVARLAVPAAGPGAVTSPRVVLGSAQLGIENTEADIKLAFQRLLKNLDAAGAGPVNFVRLYPLYPAVETNLLKSAPALTGKAAVSSYLFEGVPSLDAGFAVEAVAAAK